MSDAGVSNGEFAEPSWQASVPVAKHLSGAPEGAYVKGMFFTCVTRLAREQGGATLGRESYTGFKSYPLKEWIELLPQCAAAAYPRISLRSALFETGSHIYRTFAESTVGRVVMSVAGRDVHAAIRLTERAYGAVGSISRVTTREHTEQRVVFELRNLWEFPDCYQAGILAAGIRAYDQNPRVRVRSLSLCDCDVEVTW